MIKLFLVDYQPYINKGEIKGKWIDLSKSNDETLKKQISEISKNEEVIILDYEVDDRINNLKIGTFEKPYYYLDMVQELELLEKEDLLKINYLLSLGYSIGEALKEYENVSFYPNITLLDLAHNMVNEGIFGDIPDSIKSYIDYEKIAQDLELEGYDETELGVFYI